MTGSVSSEKSFVAPHKSHGTTCVLDGPEKELSEVDERLLLADASLSRCQGAYPLANGALITGSTGSLSLDTDSTENKQLSIESDRDNSSHWYLRW